MSLSFNQLTLAGNLTRETELSFTASQMPVCKVGIAVNKKVRDQDKTCFVDLVAFQKTAEAMNKYFTKGDPILVTGELQFEQWTAQDGTKRNKHSMWVKDFKFVQSRQDGQSPQQAQPQSAAPSGAAVMDGDIPF